MGKTFDAIMTEFGENFPRELNFLIEKDNTERARAIFARNRRERRRGVGAKPRDGDAAADRADDADGTPPVVVPRVYDELCTKSVLAHDGDR